MNYEPIEIPSHYPDWLKDFFNAETTDLPGFFGHWWDMNVDIDEDFNSITIYDGADRITKLATFYGEQHNRRREAVKWLGQMLIGVVAMDAIAGEKPFTLLAELPLRLMFAPTYGNKVFGGEWK